MKLWVTEWLDGTTRYQMSGAQRAFWIDLLAMAGRSRCPGVICAGQDGNDFVGYPLSKFAALDTAGEIDVLTTFALFERTGKITVEVTAESPAKLYKVTVLNWDKYQSEYSRQKRYRKGYADGYTRKSSPQVTPQVTPKNTEELQAKLQPTLLREGEGEGEGEEKHRANTDGSHAGNDLQSALDRVWQHYLSKLGKNPKLSSFTSARRNKGMARLRECLQKAGGDLEKAEALMKLAVDALAASDFHRGSNDRQKAYDSWERNLFANQEQLERWLEQAA